MKYTYKVLDHWYTSEEHTTPIFYTNCYQEAIDFVDNLKKLDPDVDLQIIKENKK